MTFKITVFNQGTVSAGHIELIDFLPPELALEDDDWVVGSDGATISLTGVMLRPGEEHTVEVTVKVQSGGDIRNVAEISEATAVSDTGVPIVGSDGLPHTDVDSTPDTLANDVVHDDEVNNANGDEDDHDVAVLAVPTTPEELAYTGIHSGHIFAIGASLLGLGVIIDRFGRSRSASGHGPSRRHGRGRSRRAQLRFG